MKCTFHKIVLTFILCNQLAFPQIADTAKNKLENQQKYIRSIVEKEKDQILHTYSKSDSSNDIRTELQINQLPSIDSLLEINKKQILTAQRDATALKNATLEKPQKKSKFAKIMLIGGLSGGAIAGALAYFLNSSNNSKSGSGANDYINDKPPMHP